MSICRRASEQQAGRRFPKNKTSVDSVLEADGGELGNSLFASFQCFAASKPSAGRNENRIVMFSGGNWGTRLYSVWPGRWTSCPASMGNSRQQLQRAARPSAANCGEECAVVICAASERDRQFLGRVFHVRPIITSGRLLIQHDAR